MRIFSPKTAAFALSALLAFGSASTLTGCAAPAGPTVTPTGKGEVLYGSVIQVREIWVEVGANMPGMGAVAGAVVGAAVADSVTSGRAQAPAMLGGAVLGGMAGSQLDQPHRNHKRLTELTVRLDIGIDRVYNIEPEEAFRVGERVKEFKVNGYTRITH